MQPGCFLIVGTTVVNSGEFFFSRSASVGRLVVIR